MDDGANETTETMLDGLTADLAALVASDEMSADEAREIAEWLGNPYGT